MAAQAFITSSAAFKTYPLLHSFTTGELRARFILISYLNAAVRDCLPLIDLRPDAAESPSSTSTAARLAAVSSVSTLLMRHRGLLFSDVKTEWVEAVLVMTGTSTAAQRPKLTVNRCDNDADGLHWFLYGRAVRNMDRPCRWIAVTP